MALGALQDEADLKRWLEQELKNLAPGSVAPRAVGASGANEGAVLLNPPAEQTINGQKLVVKGPGRVGTAGDKPTLEIVSTSFEGALRLTPAGEPASDRFSYDIHSDDGANGFRISRINDDGTHTVIAQLDNGASTGAAAGDLDAPGGLTTAGALSVSGAASVGALTCSTIDTGNGALELAAGTYTPTLTESYGLTSVGTPDTFTYTRIGSIVDVAGRITGLTPDAVGTEWRVFITLPIASALANIGDVAGVGSGGPSDYVTGPITADTAGDQARLTVLPNVGGAGNWATRFQYQIL